MSMTDGKRKWGAHGLLLMGNNKLVAAVPKSLEDFWEFACWLA